MTKKSKLEPKFAALFDQVKTDPHGVLRKGQVSVQALDLGYHKALYQWLAVACGFVIEAKNSPRVMRVFLKMDWWDELEQPPKERNILRLVMMYLLSTKKRKGPVYDRACNYTVALKRFIEESVDPKSIPERIERAGGIDKLSREAAKSVNEPGTTDGETDSKAGATPRASLPSKAPAPHSAPKLAERGSVQRDVKRAPEPELDDESPARPVRRSEPVRANRRFDPDQHVVLEADRGQREQFFSMSVGDSALVTTRRLPDDDDGWARFDVLHIRLNRD